MKGKVFQHFNLNIHNSSEIRYRRGRFRLKRGKKNPTNKMFYSLATFCKMWKSFNMKKKQTKRSFVSNERLHS